MNNMRRIVLIVSVAILALSTPVASDTFVNLDFKTQTYGLLDLKVSSIGPLWLFLPAAGTGFYGQLAPSIARTFEVEGYPPLKLSDVDMFGAGFGFTLGICRRVEVGSLGLALGGGFTEDVIVLMDEPSGDSALFVTLGVGGGIHLLGSPPDSPLMFDAGLSGAWRPLGMIAFIGSDTTGLVSMPRTFEVNISGGIGFKRAPRPERPDRDEVPSLDDSITGPRRRMALDVAVGGGSMGSVRFWVFPVRDIWFVRGGLGFTAVSASPFATNIPLSVSTGIYLFPRKLRTFRLYIGVVDTVNLFQYVQERGLTVGGVYPGRRLVQNLGLAVGAEYNLTERIGFCIEPSFYPANVISSLSEGSAFQIAAGLRVVSR